MFIATNLKDFHSLFTRRLHRMLSPDELGAFILVLANSMQNEKLMHELSYEIKDTYEKLKSATESKKLRAPHDDLLVFEKIINRDLGSIPYWQTEQHGVWSLLINPMRSMRPARASQETVDSIFRRFDDTRFHFNKAFLRPEILWEGHWHKVSLRVLYNKFPFAPFHLLIVPEPDLCLPQYLNEKYHRLAWQLVEQQVVALPGFAIGYNSLGACASVNHFHLQAFIDEKALPIESEHWRHNGGDEDYPMYCEKFSSVDEAWQRISTYHQLDQPYNLLYRPACCYLIPRQMQGSKTVNEDVQGAGWIEQCGVFSVPDRAAMHALDADRLCDDLRSLSVTMDGGGV